MIKNLALSRFQSYVDAEEACQTMEIVLISGHGDDLRDDRLLGPVRAELLDQLLQVVGGGLADGVDVIDEPCHAEAVQLLVEELHPELAWKF